MRIIKGFNVVKAFLESGNLVISLISLAQRSFYVDVEKDKISTESLCLRLVRVDLPSGEPEVLVSSLTDFKAYPTALFSNLCHQHWGVEEDFKVLNIRLNIENYSNVSVEDILQNLHTKLLTKNLATSAIHYIKRKITINRRETIPNIGFFLAGL
jgi:hypothetical protein